LTIVADLASLPDPVTIDEFAADHRGHNRPQIPAAVEMVDTMSDWDGLNRILTKPAGVLYLPRGRPHAAPAIEGPSIRLSFPLRSASRRGRTSCKSSSTRPWTTRNSAATPPFTGRDLPDAPKRCAVITATGARPIDSVDATGEV